MVALPRFLVVFVISGSVSRLSFFVFSCSAFLFVLVLVSFLFCCFVFFWLFGAVILPVFVVCFCGLLLWVCFLWGFCFLFSLFAPDTTCQCF